jgi:hypothetical protein
MLFLGLGLIELLFCAVLLIALIIATAFDRRGHEAYKWLVLIVGGAFLWVHFGDSFTLWGNAHVAAVIDPVSQKVTKEAYDRVVLWDAVMTAAFWRPAGLYFGAGLLYVLFEFFFGIWRAKNQYADRWAKFLKTTINGKLFISGEELFGVNEQLASKGQDELKSGDTYSTIFRSASANGDIVPLVVFARDRIDGKFDKSNTKAEWIHVERIDGTLEIEPKIAKWNLTQWVTAWTLFWPAYGLSLIFGDLLAEAWKAFTDFLVYISRHIVKFSFAGIFKF